MQQVVCDLIRCAYRSQSGFYLNRLVKITEQGQCERLLKAGWQEKKENWQLSTFNPWEVETVREPDEGTPEIEEKEKQGQIKDGKDGPPRD